MSLRLVVETDNVPLAPAYKPIWLPDTHLESVLMDKICVFNLTQIRSESACQ